MSYETWNHLTSILEHVAYSVLILIHRVSETLQIKVGDFGLARDVYSSDYYKASQNAKLPVKWMPPETLHDAVSNERTDVVRNDVMSDWYSMP